MPILLQWHDPEQKNILVMRYEAPWNWTEYAVAFDDATEMTKSVPHKVDMIVDYTGVRHLPAGNPWPIIQRIARIKPENAGLVIMVQPPRIGEVMFNIFDRILPEAGQQVRMVDTLEEAFDLIEATN